MISADSLMRFGLVLPPRRPTLLLCGVPDEIERLYPVADAALEIRCGYRLVLAAPEPDLAALRRRYPHEIVLPLPHPLAAKIWRRRLGVVSAVGRSLAPVPAPEAIAETLPPLEGAPPAGPSRAAAWLTDWAGGRRIRTLRELRDQLGQPATIICLGNGPSSEDQRLARYSGATLFRVNWIWRERGFLTEPDVVFTTDPDLPGPGRPPVIVFPTTAAGRPILLRHTLRRRPPRAGYAFLDDIGPPLAELSGRRIPTNGALMVATAAALRPFHIVIAGIDLYRHPAGRYPGDGEALNGYAREHSADIDLALIRAALGNFAGRVTILSANLRAALGRDQDGD